MRRYQTGVVLRGGLTNRPSRRRVAAPPHSPLAVDRLAHASHLVAPASRDQRATDLVDRLGVKHADLDGLGQVEANRLTANHDRHHFQRGGPAFEDLAVGQADFGFRGEPNAAEPAEADGLPANDDALVSRHAGHRAVGVLDFDGNRLGARRHGEWDGTGLVDAVGLHHRDPALFRGPGREDQLQVQGGPRRDHRDDTCPELDRLSLLDGGGGRRSEFNRRRMRKRSSRLTGMAWLISIFSPESFTMVQEWTPTILPFAFRSGPPRPLVPNFALI